MHLCSTNSGHLWNILGHIHDVVVTGKGSAIDQYNVPSHLVVDSSEYVAVADYLIDVSCLPRTGSPLVDMPV